ncbi:MAG TPA: UbiA-like polyprenyltransferase [Planctomycetota bacterium]|nr:UbiA-like polyprenyltransferase [Planctomycetota bacterium]
MPHRPAILESRFRDILRKTADFLDAIKVSHSVFALPFAISAAFLAAGGLPPLALLGKAALAVVLARTAAMAFNRWADARIDGENPRTRDRAVPAGRISRASMGLASLAAAAGFVLVALWIHPLAFQLSPIVLGVLFGYSYTKRFTSLSHLVLGAALGLSPLGAWVAVREEIGLLPAVLGLAVLFWTAGFDIIYACQDHDFDRSAGLHSIPRRLGVARALVVSRIFHAAAILLLVLVGFLGSLGAVYAVGVAAVAVLIVYEHSLVRAGDLSRVNLAFFTLNGLVSLVFMAAVVLETVI